MSLGEFLSMDGYAVFVWPSFIVTIAALAWNVFSAHAALRRALVEAKRRMEIDLRTGREGALQ